MRLGSFVLWVSPADALSIGCTHHALLFGIIPGFAAVEPDGVLWVSRSDAFAWIEDALCVLAGVIRSTEGEDPVFALKFGEPIAEVLA